jgi:hypothetical protein
MHGEARNEPAPREEIIGLLEIAVDEDILPWNQNLFENQDRVIFIEAARQRIIERRSRNRGIQLI